MSERYNGWANYETWVTHPWITNERPAYDYALELVGGMSSDTRAADRLESWIEEGAPETTGLYADLLQGALDRIDWHEIVAALRADYAEINGIPEDEDPEMEDPE